jgi:hypothetical protein
MNQIKKKERRSLFVYHCKKRRVYCSRREYVPILQCSTERGFEDLAENPPGKLLARGSMPLHFFVDFKKPEEKH